MKDVKKDILEQLIDEYVDNSHCGNGLADMETKAEILGMLRYAYILSIITGEECDYYRNCLNELIYVGD